MNLSTQVHTYLTTAPTSDFLEQEVKMVAHWEGNDNLLWRVACGGQEAVLKLYLDAGQARSRRQYDGQQIFAPLGLAPRPLWYDRYPHGLSRQVLVYTWMPGEPLDANHPDQWTELARAVALIHSHDASEVRRFSPHPVNLDYFWRVLRGNFDPIRQRLSMQQPILLDFFEQLAQKITLLVEAALPLWQTAPPTPVHGDLKLENCIQSFGAAVLLDWEMFGIGDPALDVANLLYLNRDVATEERQVLCLDTYLATFEQEGLAQRIGVYGHLLPFQSVCYLLNGIRELPADLPNREEVLPFLASTLNASLHEAATLLKIETSTQLESTIHELFESLTSSHES